MSDDGIFLVCVAIAFCVLVVCLTECTMQEDRFQFEKSKWEHSEKSKP